MDAEERYGRVAEGCGEHAAFKGQPRAREYRVDGQASVPGDDNEREQVIEECHFVSFSLSRRLSRTHFSKWLISKSYRCTEFVYTTGVNWI